MQDLSRVCDLHHSSRQYWILNPLSKARDRTHNVMVMVGFVFTAPQEELLRTPFLTLRGELPRSQMCPLGAWPGTSHKRGARGLSEGRHLPESFGCCSLSPARTELTGGRDEQTSW